MVTIIVDGETILFCVDTDRHYCNTKILCKYALSKTAKCGSKLFEPQSDLLSVVGKFLAQLTAACKSCVNNVSFL